MNRILAIINGKHKNCYQLVDILCNAFDKIAIFEYVVTKQGEAQLLAKKAVEDAVDVVISVGGDGTLNEVLNGILEIGNNIANIPTIAIYPNGTGNDFARSLGITKDINQLVELIKNNVYQVVDCAKSSFIGLDGKKNTRYYLNNFDVGIGSETVKKIMRLKHVSYPSLTYKLCTALSALTMRTPEIILSSPQFNYKGKITELSLANGRYFGCGIGISPYSDLYDGMLDIVVIRKMSLLRIIKSIKKLINAEPVTMNETSYHKTQQCFIQTACDRKLPIQIDGELLGYTPVEIKIFPASVKIFANKKDKY